MYHISGVMRVNAFCDDRRFHFYISRALPVRVYRYVFIPVKIKKQRIIRSNFVKNKEKGGRK